MHRVLIENNFETLYYAPVYLGTPAQHLEVIYDTGSDWMAIEAKECETCLNNTYDADESITYERVNATLGERRYGSAVLNGYESRETAALDNYGIVEVERFRFFEIVQQTGLLEYIDGILGLSRKMSTSAYVTGPLYIEYLQKAGIIQEQIFSFYMARNDTQSYVDIGYYDGDSMKSAVVWIPMPTYTKVLFWFARSSALRFGPETLTVDENSFTFDNYLATIFDTGTSMTLVPNSLASHVFGTILAGHRYMQFNGLYSVSCQNKREFQSMFLMVEGYWLEWHPDDYVIEMVVDGVTTCVLGLSANDADYWLLGDSFLRGYYTIHDMANDRIGFALHATSDKQEIRAGTNPKRTFTEIYLQNTWAYRINEGVGMLFGWLWIPLLFIFCCALSCILSTVIFCIYWTKVR